MRDGESKKVWLKGVPFEVVLVKKVFTNEDGSIVSVRGRRTSKQGNKE
jgi:hypothetical protein